MIRALAIVAMILSAATAARAGMTLLLSGSGSSGGPSYMLINSGSIMLINTGSKLEIHG